MEDLLKSLKGRLERIKAKNPGQERIKGFQEAITYIERYHQYEKDCARWETTLQRRTDYLLKKYNI